MKQVKNFKRRVTVRSGATLLALALSGAGAHTAWAQVEPAAGLAAGQPAGQMRFYVELKDATLADALEMVFKAAGNPSHIIDDSARLVNIANSTFPNHDWHSIVRQLTATYNFRFYKNDSGTWVIEPRTPPPAAPGGFGGGFSSGSGGSGSGGFGGSGSGSFGSGSGTFSGPRPGGGFTPRPGRPGGAQGGGQMGGGQPGSAVPTNPFGGGQMGGGQMGGGQRPEVRNFVNPQTAPAFGGGAAGADTGSDEKTFRILTVKHVYVGGIAMLFKGTGLVPTQPFVSPMSAGGQGGGGGGGFGGQGGGFGGQQGGFGGQQGGFGGGGFGGQQGGGFGGGGFGGQGGGFGGGGFGGQGGGFGGGGFGRR